MENYDFSGWATRNDLKCSDGRVIRAGAFKHCDGMEVPLVWNHQHNDPENILGKALLHNMDQGVYAYCTFNDSESGKQAKILVQHGDVKALSIYANQLQQKGCDVLHGAIREVSLVLAGANPGAFIDSVIKHGEESEEEAVIYTGEDIVLAHSEEEAEEEETEIEHSDEDNPQEISEEDETLEHANKSKGGTTVDKDEKKKGCGAGCKTDPKEKKKGCGESDMEPDKTEKTENTEKTEKTVKDVFDTFTEEQKTVVYALIGQALEDAKESDEEDDMEDEMKQSDNFEGGNDTMKHNIFDNDKQTQENVLSHSDQMEIINLAKSPAVGSLKTAMEIYASEHSDTLAHGFQNIGILFPDYKDVYPGAPDILERDQSWVGAVMQKAHKSPVSRVRTRHADARVAEVKARGYNNRETAKKVSGNIKLLMRTTEPQTVYYRDSLHRDDVLDIDFDVVAYQQTVMRHSLEEKVALAALVGDQLDDSDPDKIQEDKIRPIWTDDDLYTIKATLDLEGMAAALQGTGTPVNFGDNYSFSEAFIETSLYAREKYKGKALPDLFCEPHTLNRMLMARDSNGRRIYESREDLIKILNVGNIYTVEQFENLVRTDEHSKKFKLLGLYVNMGSYTFGSAKGGEITNFDDFDIDFNTYKYLMETRLSGALTDPYSAIAIEMPVTNEGAAG